MSAVREDLLPHLRPRENLERGLQRIVRQCAELANRDMASAPTDAAVHQARQALKRARAILRVAETLGVSRARSIRRRLTALARKLSPLRDDAVIAHLARKLESKANSDLRSALVELQLRDVAAPTATWWAAWRRQLSAEVRALDRVPWESLAGRDLAEAVASSVKRVLRWARRARDSRDIATLHEWRKAVIALREQVLVMRPLLQRLPPAMHEQLHELARELGRATDLSVLLDAARDHDWPADLPNAGDKLGAWLRQKQRRAMKRARRDWPALKRELRATFDY